MCSTTIYSLYIFFDSQNPILPFSHGSTLKLQELKYFLGRKVRRYDNIQPIESKYIILGWLLERKIYTALDVEDQNKFASKNITNLGSSPSFLIKNTLENNTFF